MKSIVIGMGDTGKRVYDRISNSEVFGFDLRYKDGSEPEFKVDVMHICFPYNENFVASVKTYEDMYKPGLTVFHKSVPNEALKGLKGPWLIIGKET